MGFRHTGNMQPTIDYEEHTHVGPESDPGPAAKKVIDAPTAVRVAEKSGDTNITYVGDAKVGTASSAAEWRIMEIDETSGTVITWADGDEKYDNIWDNRESLTYS